MQYSATQRSTMVHKRSDRSTISPMPTTAPAPLTIFVASSDFLPALSSFYYACVSGLTADDEELKTAVSALSSLSTKHSTHTLTAKRQKTTYSATSTLLGAALLKTYADSCYKRAQQELQQGFCLCATYQQPLTSEVELCAYCLLEPQSDYLFLENLVVLPPFRRQGVASALLDCSLLWCQHKKLPLLALTTIEPLTAACSLYRRRGMSETLAAQSKLRLPQKASERVLLFTQAAPQSKAEQQALEQSFIIRQINTINPFNDFV